MSDPSNHGFKYTLKKKSFQVTLICELYSGAESGKWYDEMNFASNTREHKILKVRS